VDDSRILTLRVHLDSLAEEIRIYRELIAEQRAEGADVAPSISMVNEMARIWSEGQRELISLSRERSNHRALPPPPLVLPPEADGKPESQSIIAAWRIYEAFRADMIHREQVWRAQHEHLPALRLEIGMLAGHSGKRSGDSEKSMKRQMRKYHLDPARDWPPSIWPEHEPTAFGIGEVHRLSFAAAVPIAFYLVMDALGDGRLNGIWDTLRLICSPWKG
jgi:hypothetical protein